LQLTSLLHHIVQPIVIAWRLGRSCQAVDQNQVALHLFPHLPPESNPTLLLSNQLSGIHITKITKFRDTNPLQNMIPI